MGKQTGCGARAGKVKRHTPKVEESAKKPQPRSGRAAKRNKLAHQVAANEGGISFNSHSKIDKFGSFPSDCQPSSRDPNADMWDKKLHNQKKTTTGSFRQSHGRTHHQEAGKQWSRPFQSERDEKIAGQAVDGSSCEDSDSQTASDVSGGSDESFTESDEESSTGELSDLAFIRLTETDASYNRDEFGFHFQADFLASTEMQSLLDSIETGTWIQDNEKKRVQVFGYNYVRPNEVPLPIPAYFDPLLKRIEASGYGSYSQLIISEFLPGIGVNPHVDRFFWQEAIIGISLLSSCVMEFTPVKDGKEASSVVLVPGSLYRLQGQSRYEYYHSIPGDTVTARRISLTFRNLSKTEVSIPSGTANLLELD